MLRSAGVLLAVTSLPSKYGIGCFSQSAYDFVDWLAKAGQKYWQILPLGATSHGAADSPYQAYSAFAGNPYLISLESLIDQGVLTEEECSRLSFGNDPEQVDYDLMYQNRLTLLRKAYERCNVTKNPGYRDFIRENGWWLDDYALFMALKGFFGGKSWNEWPQDIRMHWDNAISYYSEKLYYDVEFQKYMQYAFYDQWKALKQYANDRNIQIVGDMPIYVSGDSADVWAHPELFQLDEDNQCTFVAGCPPDDFTPDGQLWGNPIYRWDYHRQTGYRWWITRLDYSFRLYDVVRIDHFRGFDAYYSIPAGSKTARHGTWVKGPGMELFAAIKDQLGELSIIAEDLGYMTQSVREMVKATGFPNMKVLEFAFDPEDELGENEYLPHNYGTNCVCYTGTHDNMTVAGWFGSLSRKQQRQVREYLGDFKTPGKQYYKNLIGLAMGSVADMCIIPMQDYLGLDNSGRMNTPGTVGINWQWRMTRQQMSDALQQQILATTKRYGRVNTLNFPKPKREEKPLNPEFAQ